MQEENLTEQKARLRSRAVCVVIPTYNNAGTILDVVRRSLEQCDDVIVVCDGLHCGIAFVSVGKCRYFGI